ncbi:DEAD/DEAH box helicase [Schumannella sp. 10F1B-5-1]|uniref:DEAD/DEAH box helicase n=1 Tax=Schumannella sp. 10F1B-5-1 TaxID=2590780 RepID=UPI001131EAA2|nr:DEAD/DEAH box helicase [Schumannella sp. 10F1B-5-1]TPW76937.1 DEAD/DEAH box helicase [Schumannella sp. 10F1B-5-1]
MPKNSGAYSRAGKSNAPRGGSASGGRTGGPSPKHRGYRPDAEGAGRGGKKPRWSGEQRVARGHSSERPRGGERDARRDAPADGRPNWEPRNRNGETAEPGYRGGRNGGARGGRDFGGDRGGRFDRDRGPREDRFGDRPRRDFGDRDDRGFRGDRDENRGGFRGDRRDNGGDRPRRQWEDRPAHDGGDRAERAPRRDYGDRDGGFRGDRDRGDRFDRGDRGPRENRFDGAGRSERAPRALRHDHTPFREDRGDRPARDDRPRRDFDREDRGPRRDFGDRDRDRAPRRDFGDRDGGFRGDRFDRDRGPRREFSDRPRRDFGDRPRRDDDRGYRGDRETTSHYGPSRDRVPGAGIPDDVVLERLTAEAINVDDIQATGFADLGLGGNIVSALAEMGASSPFPIQAGTIPVVLEGRDVLGRGRTGSGKTIAFGAPLVERLLRLNAEKSSNERRKPGRAPRAIILAPTRELALQIDRTVQPIARSVGLFTTQLYGGVPYARQYGALQRGVDIVVGTPGRIGDLVSQGRLDLSQIETVVLDEADHMCDLGFLEPVQDLLRRTPETSQKLLFSATLDAAVAALVDEFLREPAVYEVAGEDQDASTIEHRVFLLDQRDKQAVLAELAAGPGKKLVFARTRAFAEDLTDMLEDHGIRAVSLHGDLNQSRRTRNLEKLTSGRATVLVATDVAARGIHVDAVTLVIQADAPDDYKTYLHRAGRTGRAGKDGIVVTLAPFNRRRRTESLLQRAEIDAEWTEVRPRDELVGVIADRANGYDDASASDEPAESPED